MSVYLVVHLPSRRRHDLSFYYFMETFEKNMLSWLITNLKKKKNHTRIKFMDHLLFPFFVFCFQVVFFKQKQ
jgi:hypothetical protein